MQLLEQKRCKPANPPAIEGEEESPGWPERSVRLSWSPRPFLVTRCSMETEAPVYLDQWTREGSVLLNFSGLGRGDQHPEPKNRSPDPDQMERLQKVGRSNLRSR